jgi:RHS repeat-associated protein
MPNFRTRHVTLGAITLLASTAPLAIATPAVAQSAPAPQFIQPDQNGVDLVSGLVQFQMEENGVGSGPGRVAMQRIWAQSAGWTDNWTGGLFVKTSGTTKTFYVQIAGVSDTFAWASGNGPYSNLKGTPSTLERDAATGKYTYTSADGTTILFAATNTNLASACPSADAWTCNIPVEITQPNGLKFRLSWQQDQSLGQNYVRLLSVESSARYNMSIDYVSNVIGPGPSPNADWSKRLKLRFYNYAISTTQLGQTDYTYGTNTVSITDQAQRTWSLTTGAGGLTGIRRPGSATDNITYVYGTNGLVSSATKDGVTLTYALSQAFPLSTITVTDQAGKQTAVTSPPIARPISYKDPLNRTTSYTYTSDQNGLPQVKRVTQPEGNYVEYTYDARGNVTDTTYGDKTGTVTVATHATYAACTTTNRKWCDKPQSITDANGYVTQYVYSDAHGGVTSIKPPKPTTTAPQPETVYSYTGVASAAGDTVYMPDVISACQTQGAGTCAGTADETRKVYVYNDNLLPTQVKGTSGVATIATTTFTYDSRGNRINADGPLTGTADTWAYKFDSADRLIGAISPDPDGTGPMTKYRAVRITYRPDSQVSKREIGTTLGQLDSDFANFALIKYADTFFDTNARPYLTSLLGFNGTSFVRYAQAQTSYDFLGRVDCVAIRMDRNQFSNDNSLSACTQGANSTASGPDRISRNVYDNAGQLVQVRVSVGAGGASDPGVAERTMSYTPNGKLEYLIDGNGQKSQSKYDGFDRQLCLIYPSTTRPASYDGSTQGTALATSGAVSGDCVSAGAAGGDYEKVTNYDNSGNVISSRNRAGQITSFTYDKLNRVTLKDVPGTEYDVSYDYDNLSRLKQVTQKDANGATVRDLSFTYDALSRNLTQTGPNGTVSSTWDAAGRRTQISYPGTGLYLNYDYLLSGEVQKIRENGATSGIGVLATYAYDDLGNRSGLTLGNGAATTYAYDPVSRLETLTNTYASTANNLAIGPMGYNPTSDITTSPRSNDAYTYTGAYAVNRSYTGNGLNQYLTAGPANLTYDTNGNVTSDGSNSFCYSSENLLISSGGTCASPAKTLTYDPMMRLYQVSGTATTRFAYDGAHMIAEYDQAGALQKRYVWGPGTDEPLVQYDAAGTRTWMSADERGSVVALSNDAGAVTAKNKYDEYGVPETDASTHTISLNSGRFQYTGQAWLPELGMYHYKARIYSPYLGRFLQTDPIRYGDGMNIYAYTRNNPINYSDPLGLECTPTIAHWEWYEYTSGPNAGQMVPGSLQLTGITQGQCRPDERPELPQFFQAGFQYTQNGIPLPGYRTEKKNCPAASPPSKKFMGDTTNAALQSVPGGGRAEPLSTEFSRVTQLPDFRSGGWESSTSSHAAQAFEHALPGSDIVLKVYIGDRNFGGANTVTMTEPMGVVHALEWFPWRAGYPVNTGNANEYWRDKAGC